MNDRRLDIWVTQDRYSARFNTPRHSRHRLHFIRHAPTHQLSKRLEAVTIFPRAGAPDLIHAYNRIPLGPTPFVVGFESHMPRYWWRDALSDGYARLLVQPRCRRILASSECAAAIFRDQHADHRDFAALEAKLQVVYPNIDMPDGPDALADDPCETLRILFVGGHFGRKGGCVAVRVAELARERGIPIHVTVVSSLQVSRGIWSDPADPAFFEPYLKGLTAENVTHLAGAPNSTVLDLLARSHFSILATFSDTFGWSCLESFSRFTPVIATPQGALSEFIEDGVNGLMLPLAVNGLKEWVHLNDPKDRAFETRYRDAIEEMAEAAIAKLERLVGQPDALRAIRHGARATCERLFDGRSRSAGYDAIYDEAVGPGVVTRRRA